MIRLSCTPTCLPILIILLIIVLLLSYHTQGPEQVDPVQREARHLGGAAGREGAALHLAPLQQHHRCGGPRRPVPVQGIAAAVVTGCWLRSIVKECVVRTLTREGEVEIYKK